MLSRGCFTAHAVAYVEVCSQPNYAALKQVISWWLKAEKMFLIECLSNGVPPLTPGSINIPAGFGEVVVLSCPKGRVLAANNLYTSLFAVLAPTLFIRVGMNSSQAAPPSAQPAAQVYQAYKPIGVGGGCLTEVLFYIHSGSQLP